jgi:drug/metabolite transporter (DMT)-like permease
MLGEKVDIRRITGVLIGSIGALVFNARPDRWTLIGATLIIGSGLYIFYREHVVSKSKRPVTAESAEQTPT